MDSESKTKFKEVLIPDVSLQTKHDLDIIHQISKITMLLEVLLLQLKDKGVLLESEVQGMRAVANGVSDTIVMMPKLGKTISFESFEKLLEELEQK